MSFALSRTEPKDEALTQPVMALEHVSKSYPGVRALSDVSLGLHAGEVLGLVGENGAGKSTLIRILTGATDPDEGRVLLDGTVLPAGGPARRLDAGVSAIYQEFSLFPELTVAQNVFYGREPRRGPFLDDRTMRRATRTELARLGADIDPDTPVKALSVGHQQIVELAKALSRRAKVVIMDEPSAPLTNHEVEFLYAAVRRLAAEGVAILYVSHRLEEIFELCRRVVVLRDGAHVHTGPTAELDRDRLIAMMVGRTLADEFPPPLAKPGRIVLEAEHLASESVSDVSFALREGEILGLGGLVGAGRTETARILFGADPRTGGTIRLDGKAVQPASPREAIALGLGLIPEGRKHHGLLLGQSVRFNIAYAALSRFAVAGLMREGDEKSAAAKAAAALRIKTPSLEQAVGKLSGGNQQKTVLAKWLETDARILIFDEPTRGIDVGAKQEIYRLMRDLTAAGKAIIMISSEMPELIGMSDRIVVLHEGRSVATLEREAFDPNQILRFASGLHLNKGPLA